MRFEIKNKSSASVQIGALGIPMVFNNVITNKSLEQAHAQCSFADPYIGRDAGYLQVTRLSGANPALLVLPDGKTPFEAYSPILNAPKTGSKDPVAIFTDLTARGQTFEGFLEWMVHSKAYADGEWAKASALEPGHRCHARGRREQSYGVVFVLSDSIRNIEKTLVKYQRPVAVGIPGYIVPMDLAGQALSQVPVRRQLDHRRAVGRAHRHRGRRHRERLEGLCDRRQDLGTRAPDRDLRRRHGADHPLLRHQAGQPGRGRHGHLPHHQGLVRRRRAIPSAAAPR